MISQKAKNLSSASHIKKSYQTGQSGQRRFYDSCKALGHDIKQANKRQDIAHIDFFLNGETVDVKGLKDEHKNGRVILELKNVQGKDGWCSEKSSKWIAFDFGGFFLVAKTIDLIDLVKSKCDLNNLVPRLKDALYAGYTRKDRSDLITIVKIQDVLNNCHHKILPYSDYHVPMDKV